MPTQNVQSLPINNLQPNPHQPRGLIVKEELDELTQSIKNFGVLEPIVVAHTPAGYQIIAGERRWRAARAAGLSEVPVVVKETSSRGMLEMAIVENVQRTDLSALERAAAFQQLMRDFHFTTTQVAEKVGKSIPYISNTIRLLSLPDAIKDGLAGNLISEGHARAIAMIDDKKMMVECYKIVLRENASVRRTEELARILKEKIGQPVSVLTQKVIQSDEMERIKAAFQHVFSPRTQVKLVRTSRQTKVTFVFKGSPKETENELAKMMELAKTDTKES